ncbi:ATP-dependent helicase, partial [Streptomyces sp. NPDC127091]
MNRNHTARSNNSSSRSRTEKASTGSGRGGRVRSQGSGRQGAAPRSGKAGRGGGRGGRPAVSGGEFAPPVSLTRALAPVETFSDLYMPERLLTSLGTEGVT